MVRHYTISVGPFPRGFHIITPQIMAAVSAWPENGWMNIFLRHTSAGICINENADPSVREDFELYFDDLAPEDIPGISHIMEGPDDMPAHIKSALTGVSVTIPIVNHKPGLGMWQGIFLCEYRNRAGARDIIISILE